MPIAPIPPEHFHEFHSSFQGDTDEIFAACSRCGGACEYRHISALLPGEKEFMAQQMGMHEDEFADRFLDALIMPEGTELDILKLVSPCPFLDRRSRTCACKPFKVVMCEIYPVTFELRDGEAHGKLDCWCPLTDIPRFRRHFETTGIPAFEALPIPAEWLELTQRCEELDFDYARLADLRSDPEKCERFTYDTVVLCTDVPTTPPDLS